MKVILALCILIFLSFNLFGQASSGEKNNTLSSSTHTKREVSGVVKDEEERAVAGVAVTLKSKSDTLRTITNQDGIFIFRNVKENTFNITVESLFTAPFVKKYLYAEPEKLIILEPIVLSKEIKELGEVKINGVPSITYKKDTVEYRASDYKVPPQATLDQLLKKMDGMEVAKDGTLTYQGQTVDEAHLNGKEFAGGNVAQAIQNLPADIIDKVQIVNDYGIQASKTGLKEGAPQKVLNVTTKADRSIGTTARINAQGGNDDRYNTGVFVERINANEQLGVLGNINNTVTGVAPSAATNNSISSSSPVNTTGYPGTTQSFSPALNYRDQWGKNVEVVVNYAYRNTNNNSVNNSYGQQYSNLGTNNFITRNTNQTKGINHDLHTEIDYSIDSANYLQINPSYSFGSGTALIKGSNDNIMRYSTGDEHELDNGSENSSLVNSTFKISVFYFHAFKNARRNFSLLVDLNHRNTHTNETTYKDYRYFADSTQDHLLNDSAVNLSSRFSNTNSTIESTATYNEPLSKASQLQFRGDIKSSFNNSKFAQDTLLATGQMLNLPEFDNNYRYRSNDSRVTINYKYLKKETDLTLGLSTLLYNLNGARINDDLSPNISVARSVSRFIPVLRFSYLPSKTESFSLNYTGTYNDPEFQYLLPYVDRTDPLNIKIGNPNLLPSFTNTLSAGYNNYIANSRLNLSVNVNATDIDEQITTNTLQLMTPLQSNGNIISYRTINEINYINLDGTKILSTNYSISKQLYDRAYDLSLNGNITYIYTPAMSNNILYHASGWKFDERFGPQINPDENIEINPFIEYNFANTFSSTPDAQATRYRIATLAVDGKLYFLKNFQFNFSATKNYVSTNARSTNKNPLVINVGFKKSLLPRKNLVISLDAFDLLHQNTFLQQIATPQGVTNTISNGLSRYFLIGLRYDFQKWNGVPTRNGKQMKRRGDGSFIY